MAALQRDADALISNNEREFILKALKEGQRIDGRGPYELRPARFSFALDDSSATVQLGATRVMAVVVASLEAPYADRHNEGSLRFNVEFSPMASPAFEPGRPGEDAIEVARLVERGLRESRAVDLEALVVLAGRKVWHLRVDIHVLDHQGNLIDACGLAALAALMAFRRPDVTVGGGDDGQGVTVHPPESREPVPLSLHHLPLPITFALFEDGELLALDPNLKEEASAAGKFTVTQNVFGELCSLQKVEGCGLAPAQLMHCVRLATQKVEEQTALLRKALDAHAVARVQARIRRQPGAAVAGAAAGAAGAGGTAGRGVTVLRSDQLVPSMGAAVAGGDGGTAGTSGAGQQGAEVALDLDALPDSVRSMLQQAQQAAAAGHDGYGLAAMSDDDEDEDSSEDEEDSSSGSEGDGNGEENEEDSRGAEMDAKAEKVWAALSAQQGAAAAAQQAEQAAAAGEAADGGASAAGAKQKQKQQQAGAPRQQQAKKRRPAPGSGSREERQDELAAIGAMIANAGGTGSAAALDLSAAVKKTKKQGPGIGGRGRRQ